LNKVYLLKLQLRIFYVYNIIKSPKISSFFYAVEDNKLYPYIVKLKYKTEQKE